MISRLVHWFTPATPRHTVPRFHLQWHLTNACNLHCRHCYQDHQPEPDITFETVRATLDQAFDLLAFLRRVRQRPDLKLRLTLTGGEPLLSPVLFPLLELLSTQCSANDVECALLTNGTLIDRDCAHRLARYQPVYVQVSLDGPEALHEDMRGRGSFAPAVAGLQHLRQAGVTTSISFTAHAGNYRSFPEVARLGRELQVDRVWADRLIPCGRGHELATALMTPTQTEEFLHLMRQARSDAERDRHGTTQISLHRALQFLEGTGRPYRCTAGTHLLALLPDGTLFPCRRLPYQLGNINRQSLTELFAHPYLDLLRHPATTPTGCERCLYQQVCGGGLRCLAYAVHGNPHLADPGCPLATRFTVQPPTSGTTITKKETIHVTTP